MPRPCKCHATGELGNIEIFYRPVGEKYYFKNKEIYENWLIEEDLRKIKVNKRKKINDKIAKFIRYQKGQKFPTNICKEIKELEAFYGLDIILKTIELKEENIQRAMDNKEFKSNYKKCDYIMAIIRNNINDIWDKKQIDKKEFEKTKSILNSDDIDVSMPTNKSIKNKKTDISQFLDEEDMLWN